MTARSTIQKATISDGNGRNVTYWGLNLTTMQMVLTLLASVLTLVISLSVLVSPWIEYKARGVAEHETAKLRTQIDVDRERDVVRLREMIASGDKDRDRIVQQLEKLEAKIDRYFVADRKR